jgi:hypothetical protein
MKVRSSDFRVEEPPRLTSTSGQLSWSPLTNRKALPKAPERSRCPTKFSATASIRIKSLCPPIDISSNGCCGERWRDQARNVWGQSARLPSFQLSTPQRDEIAARFLWRTTRDLPERGRIGMFNRSYYEEVLIVRVHPEILRSEGLGDGALDEKTVWQNRFHCIVGLETHLHRNGTRIVKFYLHSVERRAAQALSPAHR